MNHMRLVLHNRSAKENQKLVTAGKQSGGMEVEDRRWRFSQPLDDDVKLWHGKLTRCNIVNCVFTRHLALKKFFLNKYITESFLKPVMGQFILCFPS